MSFWPFSKNKSEGKEFEPYSFGNHSTEINSSQNVDYDEYESEYEIDFQNFIELPGGGFIFNIIDDEYDEINAYIILKNGEFRILGNDFGNLDGNDRNYLTHQMKKFCDVYLGGKPSQDAT